ncbi:MAG: PLP-dependent transferase, partial [SAR116 cluster bacterium]|nr:PLP-dependent transferase [SAR116 cluster bacterium]
MSKSDNNDNGKLSLARRGAIPASASRPVATPIFPSVVYAAESADTLDAQYEGSLEGYTYAREGHPNADMLAATVDRLEGAEGGIVTASGMAAISAMFLGVLKAGVHILAGDQLYGRSLRMLGQDLPRLGFEPSFAESSDAAAEEQDDDTSEGIAESCLDDMLVLWLCGWALGL